MNRTNEVFHVVCRECEEESLVSSRRAAEAVVEDHESKANHRVDFDRVQ